MKRTTAVPAADPGVLTGELAAFWQSLPDRPGSDLHTLWMGGNTDQRRLIDLDRVRREINADGLTETEIRDAHAALAAAKHGPEALRNGTAQAALQYTVRGEFTPQQRRETAREALALHRAYGEILHGGTR